MSKYGTVDRLILMHIKEFGASSYSQLCEDATLIKEANDQSTVDRYGARNGERVIDRRLQALRKAGAIALEKRRWVIA
ncbi:hypothetical protein [Stenotrophomonas muris]|uniref:hypothetical protein n=1 Tax=Stenotrophomonas muris TaxID=2963283 RepID=UPI00383AD1AC